MQADAVRLGMIDLNTTLSAQQLVSCDTDSLGCDGGWTERGYKYLQDTGGVALEEDYPYTAYYADTGTCMENPDDFYMTIDGYYTISSEQQMIDHVKSTGPLSACVDASEWLSYTKGVIQVCGSEVDHCIQIIGVDTSHDGYWRIRNTWGTEWGEDVRTTNFLFLLLIVTSYFPTLTPLSCCVFILLFRDMFALKLAQILATLPTIPLIPTRYLLTKDRYCQTSLTILCIKSTLSCYCM